MSLRRTVQLGALTGAALCLASSAAADSSGTMKWSVKRGVSSRTLVNETTGEKIKIEKWMKGNNGFNWGSGKRGNERVTFQLTKGDLGVIRNVHIKAWGEDPFLEGALKKK